MLTIEVTADDIANGIKSSCTGCPIALATKRAIIDPFQYVAVEDNCMSVGRTDYRLPKVAADFVADFDADQSVKPFVFNTIDYDRDWDTD